MEKITIDLTQQSPQALDKALGELDALPKKTLFEFHNSQHLSEGALYFLFSEMLRQDKHPKEFYPSELPEVQEAKQVWGLYLSAYQESVSVPAKTPKFK